MCDRSTLPTLENVETYSWIKQHTYLAQIKTDKRTICITKGPEKGFMRCLEGYLFLNESVRLQKMSSFEDEFFWTKDF